MKKFLLPVLLLAAFANSGECRPGPPSPWTESLQSALTGISKLRVRSGGTCHRNLAAEKTLLEIQDTEAIASLIQHITIDDRESGFHCRCCGNPTLEFYRDREIVVSLGFHHGQSLRWPGGKWQGDASLTSESAEFLNQWLAARGITGPKREYDFGKARRKNNYRELQQKWLQAMPASLKPFWPLMEDANPFQPPANLTEMYYALALEYPDQGERLRVLLGWYGSGEGPWSDFPPYEDEAETLLLRFETRTILAAIQDRELNEQQTEGAARLFAGGTFSQRRPQDLRLLPAALKQRLLAHSLRAHDQDKQTMARKAFGE
jgi:hypothetical protein